MNSLAHLICVGLVAAGAACDETCAAAAAVSGRILLQQKESIQPMKTVEPTTLEEPSTIFCWASSLSDKILQDKQHHRITHLFFFLFTLFFWSSNLMFFEDFSDHLLKKTSFHPFAKCSLFLLRTFLKGEIDGLPKVVQ